MEESLIFSMAYESKGDVLVTAKPAVRPANEPLEPALIWEPTDCFLCA